MRKIGKKLLAVALAGVVLCTGTVTAQAGGEYCTLGRYSVGAETYANSSTYSGMSRTSSNSYEVYTNVSAIYRGYNSRTNEWFEIEKSDAGNYGSEVVFSLPTGYDVAVSILATHEAVVGAQIWNTITAEGF